MLGSTLAVRFWSPRYKCVKVTCRNQKAVSNIIMSLEQTLIGYFKQNDDICLVRVNNNALRKQTSANCLFEKSAGRDVNKMLGQCWDSVADGGPTLNRHLVNVSMLMDVARQTFNMDMNIIFFNCLLLLKIDCYWYPLRKVYDMASTMASREPSDKRWLNAGWTSDTLIHFYN